MADRKRGKAAAEYVVAVFGLPSKAIDKRPDLTYDEWGFAQWAHEFEEWLVEMTKGDE